MSLSPVQAHPFWISVLRVPSWTKLYGKLKSGNAEGDVQGKGKYQEIIYHCYLLAQQSCKSSLAFGRGGDCPRSHRTAGSLDSSVFCVALTASQCTALSKPVQLWTPLFARISCTCPGWCDCPQLRSEIASVSHGAQKKVMSWINTT